MELCGDFWRKWPRGKGSELQTDPFYDHWVRHMAGGSSALVCYCAEGPEVRKTQHEKNTMQTSGDTEDVCVEPQQDQYKLNSSFTPCASLEERSRDA